MCMADTRTMPSLTPLLATTDATWSVMRMNSCRVLVLNQRYSVVVFMTSVRGCGSLDPPQRQRRCRVDAPVAARTGAKRAQPRGGNHRGIIGGQAQGRDEHRQAGRRATGLRVAAQPAVGRHTAGDP